ncbi:uncharacterized protein B0P05DRAFT_566119 [Gilbertella persicaria]|uniref:uncharacterized protein n=1 Tax=Gilbertella persicaria TaxID=101096 RepID=UPI0022201303|nr:uncharacterized protein B0P05DRAFT_566119 [Gilbertella persicaria]KAI8047402.1 hypothetical protein B0P05DRAFT_566119 [Gilbertella persicaria]
MEHVLMWDENKVTKWMTSIGYSSYEKQFKEQGITGDVLVNLDHESLRDLSIVTVGQRMDLLKNIYQLKILYRVPVNEWDYIPPSVLYETEWLGQNGMADYRKIEAAFQERDARIKKLTEDLGRLNNDMCALKEEFNQVLKKDKKSNETSSKTSTPTKSSYHTKHTPSPTKSHNNDHSHEEKSPNVMINDGGAIKVYGDKISKVEHEPESSKNVRLLLDDTTSKVIISALKKYNVMSDWQQYALWIQYGQPDNTQERALGYDERPLRISQKLKEAKQNPVFVLKHVKDNKPFIPPNYSNPRPAPKPQKSTPKSTTTNNNNNITSGKVGFEVVIPVMSSSMSTPTANTTTSSSSSSTKRQHIQQQQQQQQQVSAYNNELGLDDSIVSAIFSINNSS